MTTQVSSRIWIPKVPKERIKRLAERIKPVVRMAKITSSSFEQGGCLTITQRVDPRGEWQPWPEGAQYYIEPVNPFNIAFAWSPKPTQKVKGLVELTDITTYHTYAYHGFFKPTIAEVLAQIPEEFLDRVVAFEIVEKPESAGDLNLHSEALNAGYHVAKTRLYVRK